MLGLLLELLFRLNHVPGTRLWSSGCYYCTAEKVLFGGLEAMCPKFLYTWISQLATIIIHEAVYQRTSRTVSRFLAAGSLLLVDPSALRSEPVTVLYRRSKSGLFFKTASSIGGSISLIDLTLMP